MILRIKTSSQTFQPFLYIYDMLFFSVNEKSSVGSNRTFISDFQMKVIGKSEWALQELVPSGS